MTPIARTNLPPLISFLSESKNAKELIEGYRDRPSHRRHTDALSVEDSGSGIDPEHLPRLFERFYRGDTSRARRSGGAGLGLASVKEIAEAHGGTVKVESEVGKGSIFIVTLPAVNDTGSR